MSNKYTNDLNALTPVQRLDGKYWMKRDDLFSFGGARGGKVRTCAKMLGVEGNLARGAVTYASRTSPQMNYTSLVCKALDIPCRVHTAHGGYTPEMTAAEKAGATLVQHRPGYMNNLRKYAMDDAEERYWRFVPMSMESEMAVQGTAHQIKNLPWGKFKRIVVVVGGGLSLAGIMRGMAWAMTARGAITDREKVLAHIPILGVCIGKDPHKSLDKWCPSYWSKVVTLTLASLPYDKPVKWPFDTLGDNDINLDPYYEAKCVEHLLPGDLFWIVGIRPTA